MSSLSQYHPFRDNINKTASAGEAIPTTNQSDSKDKGDDQEYRPWLSFKSKMRIAVFTIVVLALWYVISSFFKENPELEKGFYSSVQGLQKKSSVEAVETPTSIFDEHDLDERGRSLSDTNAKIGLFDRIFCRGGKRASFCK